MRRLTGCTALLFLAISFINCKKDNNSTPASDITGRIDFTLPIAGSIYDNGLVLKTEGGMNDDNGLSSAKVEIRNKTTGAILFQQTSATGNVTLYRFLWNWTVTGITAPITATVKVIAIDKLSNQIFKEVDVTLTN
jgi:hypothetical protein